MRILKYSIVATAAEGYDGRYDWRFNWRYSTVLVEFILPRINETEDPCLFKSGSNPCDVRTTGNLLLRQDKYPPSISRVQALCQAVLRSKLPASSVNSPNGLLSHIDFLMAIFIRSLCKGSMRASCM